MISQEGVGEVTVGHLQSVIDAPESRGERV